MYTVTFRSLMQRGAACAPRQTFGTMGDGDGGACALGTLYLGAAGFGIAGTVHGTVDGEPGNHTCPVCLGPCGRISGLIVHLNDGHKWSRSAIAAHLDSIHAPITIPTSSAECHTPGATHLPHGAIRDVPPSPSHNKSHQPGVANRDRRAA